MHKSDFSGGIIGYIGISFLQLILIVFTLGLLAPYAICIKEKWLAKHTRIDWKQVHFDGKGDDLLSVYVKDYLLTIITLGIYAYWNKINVRSFTVKHTYTEKVKQEDHKESKFSGNGAEYFKKLFLWHVLAVLTLGIAAPCAICRTERYMASHSVLNGRQVIFYGTVAQLFGNFVKWFFLTIITIGIYSFWIEIAYRTWLVRHTHLQEC